MVSSSQVFYWGERLKNTNHSLFITGEEKKKFIMGLLSIILIGLTFLLHLNLKTLGKPAGLAFVPPCCVYNTASSLLAQIPLTNVSNYFMLK